MKEFFFFLLSVYMFTLILGAFGAFIRFWVDVAKFHPKETKELRMTKRQFKKSIKEKAAEKLVSESVLDEMESDVNGRYEHNSSAVL